MKANKNLRRFRERRGMSQTEVGKALCLTGAGYGRIERGEIRLTVEDAAVLARLYGVTLTELLEEPDD